MLVAQATEPLQEAGGRRHDAHVAGDRLHDDRGDLALVGLEARGHGVDVIVRQDDRVGSSALGDAGRGRDAQREQA